MMTLPDLQNVQKVPKIGVGLGSAVKNIQKPAPGSNTIKDAERSASNMLRTTTSPMITATTDRFGKEPLKNIAAANRPKDATSSGVYGKVKQHTQTAKTLEKRRIKPPVPSIL